MSITRDQAERVARLARLALTDAELDQLRGELTQILAYMDQLQELDGAEAQPAQTLSASAEQPQETPLRTDTARPGLSREQALAEAPRTAQHSFAVPRFVEEP